MEAPKTPLVRAWGGGGMLPILICWWERKFDVFLVRSLSRRAKVPCIRDGGQGLPTQKILVHLELTLSRLETIPRRHVVTQNLELLPKGGLIPPRCTNLRTCV